MNQQEWEEREKIYHWQLPETLYYQKIPIKRGTKCLIVWSTYVMHLFVISLEAWSKWQLLLHRDSTTTSPKLRCDSGFMLAGHATSPLWSSASAGTPILQVLRSRHWHSCSSLSSSWMARRGEWRLLSSCRSLRSSGKQRGMARCHLRLHRIGTSMSSGWSWAVIRRPWCRIASSSWLARSRWRSPRPPEPTHEYKYPYTLVFVEITSIPRLPAWLSWGDSISAPIPGGFRFFMWGNFIIFHLRELEHSLLVTYISLLPEMHVILVLIIQIGFRML